MSSRSTEEPWSGSIPSWRQRARPILAEIHALSRAYLEFAAREPNLLRSMFEHRMAEHRPFPSDLLAEVNDAFARIAAPLSSILMDWPPDDVAIVARTMFSAFHGIVTMGIEERIVAVPLPRLREQVALFVDVFLSGLPKSSRSATSLTP